MMVEIQVMESYGKGIVTGWKKLTPEGKVCSLILSTAAVFSLFYIFLESADHEEYEESSDRVLGKGWWLLSKKKDIADFEWTFWFSETRFVFIALLTCHALLSVLIRPLDNEVARLVLFVHDFLWVYGLLGGRFLFVIFLICTIFYNISCKKTEAYIWITSGCALILLHVLPFAVVLHYPSTMQYSVMSHSALLLSVFRCCSFGIECCNKLDTEPRSFWGLVQYNFYLPYFFFGPVMTYNVYAKQIRQTKRLETIWHLLQDVIFIGCCIVCVDFLLHFFHVSSLPLDISFMERTPAVVAGFLAFVNVYLDWMKGRMLYALTSGIASHVDGYGDAPCGCKNIATIFTFADTFFDRSIQHWLCRYVYDPIGRDHTKVGKEAVAGGLSFVVVLFLQGFSLQTLLWAILNWVGLTSEFIVGQNTSSFQNKKIRTLTLGFNYWCILLFNCIGINGIQAFSLYFKQIFIKNGYISFLGAAVLGYCYVSINTEIKATEKKTVKAE